MAKKVNIFWFRRDLRLHDNAGLHRALKDTNPVLPVFIFDRSILDELEEKADSRVEFIHNAITQIHGQLKEIGSTIQVYYGYPVDIFKELLSTYDIEKVYTNHDYEPYATTRDEAIRKLLNDKKISFHTYKDQVIFEKDEIIKENGSPYVVFTPYSRKWIETLNEFYLKPYPTEKYFSNLLNQKPSVIPTMHAMGFKKGLYEIPSLELPREIVRNYKAERDFPGIDGTTRMGVHLRFGTISIRYLVKECLDLSDTYVKELIWREFYQMILWQFPFVGLGKSFRKEYDAIKWRNNETEFEVWCEGKTGYPIVDAGMRQLNATGFMHNRVRMVTASFLIKHLLIDWRWGEAYFANKLLDFDLASNNGGWQWAAGSGCDAAPYFRVFNPSLQTKKFDSELKYIRKWVPEFEDFAYPSPIVNHEFARKRVIDVFRKALKRELF